MRNRDKISGISGISGIAGAQFFADVCVGLGHFYSHARQFDGQIIASLRGRGDEHPALAMYDLLQLAGQAQVT